MKTLANISALFLFSSLLACTAKKPDTETIATKAKNNSSLSEQPTIVKTTPATTTTFTLQKILNGSIEADRKTTIKSEAAGFITAYHLREGAYVKKGALLLSLDDQELQLQLQQRRNELDDAITARNERFVGDGGQVDDESSVPPEKLKIINVLTGYNKALTAIKQTEFSLSRKKIFAPIAGWLADLKINDGEYISPGQEICTIIDPSSFEIRFSLLENDALSTTIGTTITAYPLLNSDHKIKGKINKINPVVDENGLVTVYAVITQKPSKLFEGMNLRIELETHIPNQIIIPKSALVSRSGRDVVFVLDTSSSLAKWIYVTIAHENKESLAISEGINPGDIVIIEGNLNLDHDAEVEKVE